MKLDAILLEGNTSFPGITLFPSTRMYNSHAVVQSLSLSDSANPRTAAHQASLSFTISWNLLSLMFIGSIMPPNFSSSVTPFSTCPQSFPASGSFPVNWLFISGGQSIGASASKSELPTNIQD